MLGSPSQQSFPNPPPESHSTNSHPEQGKFKRNVKACQKTILNDKFSISMINTNYKLHITQCKIPSNNLGN